MLQIDDEAFPGTATLGELSFRLPLHFLVFSDMRAKICR